MTKRTNDQIADELTDRITSRITSCWDGASGAEIILDGELARSVHHQTVKTDIRREYFAMTGRGIKPAVLNQVIRNVEAWVEFGPSTGEQEQIA